MVKVNRVMAEITKTAAALMRLPVLRMEVVFMMIEVFKEAIMGRTSGSLGAVANIRALHQVDLSVSALNRTKWGAGSRRSRIEDGNR